MTAERGEGSARARGRAAIGPFDLAGLALAALALAGIWGLQLLVAPSFAQMFADFGGELPAITRAVVRPVIASVASGIAVALVAAGVAARTIAGWRAGTLAIYAGAIAAVLAVPLMLWALYAPIFEVAGAIAP